MHKFFNLLASEIYYNYFLAINNNQLFETVNKILKDPSIYCSRGFDASVVSVEKDGKFYYNQNFVVEITDKIAEYLERDVLLFKSEAEIQTHFYYAILFTLSQIKDPHYLEAFFSRYPFTYYE